MIPVPAAVERNINAAAVADKPKVNGIRYNSTF